MEIMMLVTLERSFESQGNSAQRVVCSGGWSSRAIVAVKLNVSTKYFKKSFIIWKAYINLFKGYYSVVAKLIEFYLG
jgi:hypothetical protein